MVGAVNSGHRFEKGFRYLSSQSAVSDGSEKWTTKASYVYQMVWIRLSLSNITQQTHNVATTSLQRRCNVTTLARLCSDIIKTCVSGKTPFRVFGKSLCNSNCDLAFRTDNEFGKIEYNRINE